MVSLVSDKEIIQGIVSQDRKILNHIYKEYYPLVKNIILNDKGSESTAQDIFQDGLIALFTNIKTGKYIWNENTKLRTYFIQICKFRWYDIKKSARFKTTTELNTNFDTPNTIDHSDVMEEVEKQKQIHQLLDKLGEQCQKILKLFYWQKKKMDEIAIELNMETNSIKNGKYRCIKQLKEIANNSNFKNLI